MKIMYYNKIIIYKYNIIKKYTSNLYQVKQY